jgi:hypothetical protein
MLILFTAVVVVIVNIACGIIITCKVIVTVIFPFAVSIVRVPRRVGTDLIAAALNTFIVN